MIRRDALKFLVPSKSDLLVHSEFPKFTVHERLIGKEMIFLFSINGAVVFEISVMGRALSHGRRRHSGTQFVLRFGLTDLPASSLKITGSEVEMIFEALGLNAGLGRANPVIAAAIAVGWKEEELCGSRGCGKSK